MIRLAAMLAALLLAFPAHAAPREADVASLLAADRAFSAAAGRAPTPAHGIAAIFAADAVMPAPQGFASGRDAILAAFRASPAWQSGTVSWRPMRGGVSADGTQGFTFGFLTVTAGDPARRERKYLTYWVRRPEGWRAVAYRQLPRAPGAASEAMLPPSFPASSARPRPRDLPRHQASLAAAEQAFSDRAQRVGLRAAFREYGRADAMNMGSGAGFTLGAEAISRDVAGEEAASSVRWSTERAIVASSGDLGVSIGTIRRNGAVPSGEPASFPFFTIWRRDRPADPWRYIAE